MLKISKALLRPKKRVEDILEYNSTGENLAGETAF
jgi:hypothetical protein